MPVSLGPLPDALLLFKFYAEAHGWSRMSPMADHSWGAVAWNKRKLVHLGRPKSK